MIPTPIALGLIICDQVIVDRETDFPSLINVLSSLRVREFPSEPKGVSLFTTLTDSTGSGIMEVKCVHIETMEEVYSDSHPLSLASRSTIQHIHIRVHGLEFTAPGWHEFLFLVDGDIVGQRRFLVYTAEEPTSGEQP